MKPPGAFDTAVTEPTVFGAHAFFEVTVPVSVAARGDCMATCRKVSALKGLRFVDAERVDIRTWRVKAMAPRVGQ